MKTIAGSLRLRIRCCQLVKQDPRCLKWKQLSGSDCMFIHAQWLPDFSYSTTKFASTCSNCSVGLFPYNAWMSIYSQLRSEILVTWLYIMCKNSIKEVLSLISATMHCTERPYHKLNAVNLGNVLNPVILVHCLKSWSNQAKENICDIKYFFKCCDMT